MVFFTPVISMWPGAWVTAMEGLALITTGWGVTCRPKTPVLRRDVS
jgi:hypothetical protein